ncbi:hypothetical protein T01_14961 [Trichinella spiralis]|uniref:Uncharacterized protein n=1 Tax=Trichinella spiralis TaxID=6334 RepID=A0A0V1AYT2_TRISP|nr:hypothetical protein T01_9393 [Trichinella spiralis]KRY29914.1 hypothetical protein T01_14961 [Trichinella spiralis]
MNVVNEFKSGDASLYPLMLSVAFSLLLQSETMNRSLQAIEYILQLNLNIWGEYTVQMMMGRYSNNGSVDIGFVEHSNVDFILIC